MTETTAFIKTTLFKALDAANTFSLNGIDVDDVTFDQNETSDSVRTLHMADEVQIEVKDQEIEIGPKGYAQIQHGEVGTFHDESVQLVEGEMRFIVKIERPVLFTDFKD